MVYMAVITGVVLAISLPVAPAEAALKRDKSGDVKIRGLKRADRKTLDVTGVQVSSVPGLVIAEVRLAGKASRIGKGRLRRAAVGVVIKRGSARVRAVSFGSAGSGKQAVKATKGITVDSIRLRRSVAFLVAGLPAGKATARGATALRRVKTKARASQTDQEQKAKDKKAERDGFAYLALMITGFADVGKAPPMEVYTPRPPSALNCFELRNLLPKLEEARKQISLNFMHASGGQEHLTELNKRAKENLETIEEVKRQIAARCGGGGSQTPPTAPGGVNPNPANTPPTASFTFSPTNNPPTAPRAGSNVTFTGSASDSDGTITSHTWTYGDGFSITVPGPPTGQRLHAYAQAGGFNATLSVTDNSGATYVTASQRINVSGPGSKASTQIDNVDCSQAGIIVYVKIPSWAQAPFTISPVAGSIPNVCPGQTQTVTHALCTSGCPPPEVDAHGVAGKVYAITILFSGPAGVSNGTVPPVTVSWN